MYSSASEQSAHQLATQGMADAQAAWQYESVGNAAAAGPLYQRAAQCLTACSGQMGPQTPDHLSYCLGACQVRLSCLTYAAGNPAWARQWLALALPNLQAAWERNPAHPWYQLLLAQTALALGQLDLARRVCAAAPQNPQLAAVRQFVDQPAKPPQPLATVNTWVEKLTQGVDTAHKCKKLFNAIAKLFGQAHAGNAQVGGFGPTGQWDGSWTGGWEALSGWRTGGYDWSWGMTSLSG
jgi:hypothetical protein